MVKDSKAYKYARWCTREKKGRVPLYVKKQATNWLKIADGKHKDAYVNEEKFEKINKLLSIIVHPDVRQPMNEAMEDYAWLLIVATLCTLTKKDDNRYYTTSLLEIARKNFKTFYSGLLFILLMLTDTEFGRYFSVAPDLKLSSELKIAIRKIIKSSPLLADETVFKVLRSEIRCLLTDSEYTPLAYSEDKMDGKLIAPYYSNVVSALGKKLGRLNINTC